MLGPRNIATITAAYEQPPGVPVMRAMPNWYHGEPEPDLAEEVWGGVTMPTRLSHHGPRRSPPALGGDKRCIWVSRQFQVTHCGFQIKGCKLQLQPDQTITCLVAGPRTRAAARRTPAGSGKGDTEQVGQEEGNPLAPSRNG